MKGFVRKTGRPTKGGSLPGLEVQSSSRASTSRNGSESKQPAREVLPSLNGKSNGAHSPDDPPVFLRDTIEQLIASDPSASSGLNGSPAANSGLNGSNGSQPKGSHPIRIPRWKRILDLTCVFLALPFWLPVTVLLMLWVKVASHGPVFYRQRRVGYRGEHFMIFKFRTMHVNAETRTHEEYFAHLMRVDCPMTKLDHADDSRLIPGARFLRASGLDELPQIFNVLRGEMSLVGPRPCLPSEFERYEAWQQKRVNAPPGLTGYWQVNGKNNTTFREMIVMDLFYARNMCLQLDLGVMAKTVPVLVQETRKALNRYRSRKASRVAMPAPVLGQAQPIPVRVAESGEEI